LEERKIASALPAMSFRKLGTLNEDDRPAESEYGLPHPGMIIINRENVVVGKLFVEVPTLRIDSAEALVYAKRALKLRGIF
jgi:hypothetical protein